jgi:methionyl-tRNA formyltransferase
MSAQYAFFGINDLGKRCLDLLVQRGEPPLLVCTTPEDYDETVFQQAEFGLSVGHRHKIPKRILDLFPQGVVNLHTGYLPWNRGAYPNVWPIIDGSPAGVTLHLMDEGIDTGPIIMRTHVQQDVTWTAESLHRTLGRAAFDLLTFWWEGGRLMDAKPQDINEGSTHTKAELDHMSLDVDESRWRSSMTLFMALAMLRARTFDGYPGLRVRDGNTEYRMSVRIEPV